MFASRQVDARSRLQDVREQYHLEKARLRPSTRAGRGGEMSSRGRVWVAVYVARRQTHIHTVHVSSVCVLSKDEAKAMGPMRVSSSAQAEKFAGCVMGF